MQSRAGGTAAHAYPDGRLAWPCPSFSFPSSALQSCDPIASPLDVQSVHILKPALRDAPVATVRAIKNSPCILFVQGRSILRLTQDSSLSEKHHLDYF